MFELNELPQIASSGFSGLKLIFSTNMPLVCAPLVKFLFKLVSKLINLIAVASLAIFILKIDSFLLRSTKNEVQLDSIVPSEIPFTVVFSCKLVF